MNTLNIHRVNSVEITRHNFRKPGRNEFDSIIIETRSTDPVTGRHTYFQLIVYDDDSTGITMKMNDDDVVITG